MDCLAGQNGHFQSQIAVYHPPSSFFVQTNDPSILCDHFMDPFLYSFCYRLITPRSNVYPSRELISRASCTGKNSRNKKLYEKQVISIIENCKRKSNYAKGKFKTFRTRCLLKYRYSVDLPFRLEIYQKSYMCLKHRVTLRIHFFIWWL